MSPSAAPGPVLVADADRPRGGVVHTQVTDVAVGILVDGGGRYLLTTRPPGKVYAGYWEFPGGKLEAGETVAQALRRELQEEIGVTIGEVHLWREQVVDYPHALVRLHFCMVRDWTGTLQMREGQTFAWSGVPVALEPILPGTVPVLAWLQETHGRVG